MQGVVKFFDSAKGWGFIKIAVGEDIFVHRNELGHLAIDEGDKVEFTTVEGKKGKGPKACDIRLVA
jgi:cold shock protein